MSEGFICFKVSAGTVVSTKKYKSHAEAAKWVGPELAARGLKATDIIGKPSWPVDKNGKSTT